MSDKGSLFGVYIHWPFCASKCPYCDFNSHVRGNIDQAVWRDAFVKELQYYAGLTKGRVVTSVFFGGGTPSLMEPQTAKAVINAVKENWSVLPDLEITLEANPTSVEIDKFKAFRQAGINRVSIGIQSLRDQDLKFLGRRHSVAEALKALETAASIFDRYNFDLIYARPDQTTQSWTAELEEALSYGADHMSLYQLTIEKGTAFYTQAKRGDFSIPDENTAADLYECTQDIMNKAGMPAYEISNHAKSGQESRHNLTYWHYNDYVGVGPGAHGRLMLEGDKFGTRAHRVPECWCEQVMESGCGSHPFEKINADQRFTEALMMGLRLRGGVSLSLLSDEAQKPWEKCIDPKRVSVLCEEGLLIHANDNLSPTPNGMQRLNGILRYLL